MRILFSLLCALSAATWLEVPGAKLVPPLPRAAAGLHAGAAGAGTTWLVGEAFPGTTLFRLGLLIAVGWVALRLSRQQQSLSEQRDELARLNTHLEEDMRAAREIQELLLAPPPEHHAVEIGIYTQTARILGGDTADLALSPETGAGRRMAVTVADVSGKGSPAALAGAVLVGMLDDAPARYTSPAETLSYLNERLAARLPDGLFVTLFHAVLDLDAGVLTYGNAGHDLPLLIRASGAMQELETTGMALGVMADAEFEERTVCLSAGDLLFCYTDGVTDHRAASGERFGRERLLAVLQAGASMPGPELVRTIAGKATGDEELQDDVTLVAVRYLADASN